MLISLIRTIVLYAFLILTVRLMGKRQLGELEPSEFVVTMLIANLAAIPMQDGAIPLLSGLVPIATVLSMELIMAVAALKSIRLRRFLCGKPVILMENGTILEDNLRRARYTLDELTEHLRQKDILDFTKVKYAILETNGQLSVFPYSPGGKDPNLPVTLVSDGRLLRDNLEVAGKDRAWVLAQLAKRGLTLEKTLLMTVDGAGTVCCAKKGAGA